MSTSPAKNGVYRVRTATDEKSALYWDLNADQVVIRSLDETNASQKWNLVVRSGTFTATNMSNNKKLSYTLDGPNNLSDSGYLTVSPTKSTIWTAQEKVRPGIPNFAEIEVAYAEGNEDVTGSVLDSLYADQAVHFSAARDGAQNQRWLFEYVDNPPVTPGNGSGDPLHAGTDVTDQYVRSGTYSFHNVKFGNIVTLPDGMEGLEVEPRMSATKDADKWVVTLSTDKKFTIMSAKSGKFAHASKLFDNVNVETGNEQQWIIKRLKDVLDTYQIFPLNDTKRLWTAEGGDLGTQVTYSGDPDDSRTWWKIKKQMPINGDEGGQNEIPTPIPDITRPGHKDIRGNIFEMTVPKNWSVIVTAMAFNKAINWISLKAASGPLVDTFIFSNNRGPDVVALTTHNGIDSAYNASADKGPIALSFKFFNSLDPRKNDPLLLQDPLFASTLSVLHTDRSGDVRNFADFRTYNIIARGKTNGGRAATGDATEICAAVTVQLSNKKDAGNNTQPEKPKPGEVNPGYPETCDEARPDCLDQYLRKYDSVFLLDDSGSMAGGRWDQAREALHFIAREALQYDVDGVGLLFLNSKSHFNNLKGENEMKTILEQVKPAGSTPTAKRLNDVLEEYIHKLDAAVNTPAYSAIKPLDMIVITDGEPTDEPQPVLEKWAAHLDEKKHHPNIVGIQFVQIGDVKTATDALMKLTQGKVRSMVDTVPYDGKFTPEKLARVLLGAVMPSIRAKQNARL